MHEIDVEQDAAMDTQEFARIEFLLQLLDGVVDRVVLRLRCGIGQLVAREKMRDTRELDELDTLADLRRDAVGIFRRGFRGGSQAIQ